MKPVAEIEKWVAARTSFYFFLPDGPYGRPFDNQYTVETVGLTDIGIKIKFTNGLALYFTGEPDVMDEGCNLLITNYVLCRFEDNDRLIKSFDYGEVVLNGF
ncbi:hypothetical protein [Erwinia amylovora]|uniref:hypothetical protein n=1 Tax=Erwinia amylovora TaxID=552 RepID=UPI001443E5F4|nr:hypothetical protein [Erwinia amylovora]